MIKVQSSDFCVGEEYIKLRQDADGDGAIVTFTGLVRDFNEDGSVSSMFIEHYPGMTEKSLMKICSDARKRWKLGRISMIHRVGLLTCSEQIVFVGVTAQHRKDAFEGAQYIMDHLKNSAPLWKKEGTLSGMKWVDSKASDEQALTRWYEDKQVS